MQKQPQTQSPTILTPPNSAACDVYGCAQPLHEPTSQVENYPHLKYCTLYISGTFFYNVDDHFRQNMPKGGVYIWSRPIWDLHIFYLLILIHFPILLFFSWTMLIGHPSVLSRFCFLFVYRLFYILKICIDFQIDGTNKDTTPTSITSFCCQTSTV